MFSRICLLLVAAHYTAPWAIDQTLRAETSLGSFDNKQLTEFATPYVATVLPFETSERKDKSNRLGKTDFSTTTGLSNAVEANARYEGRSEFLVKGGDAPMDPMFAVFGRERDMTAAGVLFMAPDGKDQSARTDDDLNYINNPIATPYPRGGVPTQVAMQVRL